MQRKNDFPVAIIGAGFAGIGAAIQLTKAGIHSFTIFERADEIGGTWRDNTYPGAACDVQSHVYSLSFEQNPNWSRRYATSSEIQDYLLGVADPALREKLTPSFQFGCKRVLVSDDYWAAFERKNVELVTEPIEAIRPEGIETTDGTVHAFDAIVLATGFLLGLTAAPFRVIGRDGRTLDDAWKGGAVAYKGMAVAGFPNWFIMMGPNTGPGHTSVLVYTEAQISHALQAIKKIMAEDLKYMDIRQNVQDRYNEGIQKRMKHMVWSGCNSWYLSEDGSNHSLYPGFAAEYILRSRKMHPEDYEITAF